MQGIKDILNGQPKALPPGDEHFGDEREDAQLPDPDSV